MMVMVMMVVRIVKSQQHLDGTDNGAGVERDLGEWDDGDAHAHEKRQRARVAGLEQDVGGDLVADLVAEHEQADDGGGGV